MTEIEASLSIKRLYWLTSSFGIFGMVWFLVASGWKPALAFAMGAAASFGNLRLFESLSRSIAPGADTRKPWQAGVWIIRSILLLGAGYVIVKGLGVNPLALIVGLFASAAAVLTSLVWELFQTLLKSRTKP